MNNLNFNNNDIEKLSLNNNQLINHKIKAINLFNFVKLNLHCMGLIKFLRLND